MPEYTHPDLHRIHKLQLITVAKLDAMSPLKVLSRGYSVVRDSDGSILRSASQTAVGESITITLASGKLDAQVTRKEDKHEPEE